MNEKSSSLRGQLRTYKPPKIDPDLQRDLQHGWMVPYLIAWMSEPMAVGITGAELCKWVVCWMSHYHVSNGAMG